MNSEYIKDILVEVNEVFPIERTGSFAGNHGFCLIDGKLQLHIWFNPRPPFPDYRCWTVVFDSEEIGKKELLEVKEDILKFYEEGGFSNERQNQ